MIYIYIRLYICVCMCIYRYPMQMHTHQASWLRILLEPRLGFAEEHGISPIHPSMGTSHA